jgi:hypothetical protein
MSVTADDRAALEARFHSAMLDTYDIARRACRYNATYFLRMVQEHGGLETAHRLLQGSEIAYGLTQLWECGHLDISAEAQVLRPEFRLLFADQELAEARRRLAQLNYVPPWGGQWSVTAVRRNAVTRMGPRSSSR